MTARRMTLAVAMVIAAACATADGPPEIVVDRTACSHCGMLISEPVYAAAYQVPGAAVRVFDDLGCLREAARNEHTGLHVWVHDAASGEWIDGETAAFVSSSAIRTPMGGGILAYRHTEDADRSAIKYKGRVLRTLANLFDGKGAQS